jgi:hypothetical protein
MITKKVIFKQKMGDNQDWLLQIKLLMSLNQNSILNSKEN